MRHTGASFRAVAARPGLLRLHEGGVRTLANPDRVVVPPDRERGVGQDVEPGRVQPACVVGRIEQLVILSPAPLVDRGPPGFGSVRGFGPHRGRVHGSNDAPVPAEDIGQADQC
jgi:hypothetical protein